MNLRKAAAVFAVIVGVMMIAQWSFFMAAGEVTELETEPVRISFHLAAEFITATVLIIAGLALIKQKDWAFPIFMLALGMLSYTIVVSPGYFAQDGDYVFVGMFVVLWVLTVAFILLGVKEEGGIRGGGREEK